MSRYEILNPLIDRVATDKGWTGIEHRSPYSWGYRYHSDVMPQPIDIDVQLTDACLAAGRTIGLNGCDAANAVERLTRQNLDLSVQRIRKDLEDGLTITSSKKRRRKFKSTAKGFQS